MPIEPPRIDPRNQQMLVKQVRELAVYNYCEKYWKKDISQIKSDKYADVLINIFCWMMNLLIQRLNKVPDKNFLAFLDMIGVRLSPPRAARAPLTFTMAKGATQSGSIPAGTQVATAQTKEKEAVVFETENNLTVIAPNLVKAVSISPDDDRWRNHSPVLFEKKPEGFEELFKGKNLIPHRIFLGHKKLFSFKETSNIMLNVQLKKELSSKSSWEVRWYYYREGSPSPILLHVADKTDPLVANLLNSGEIIFSEVSGISEKTLIQPEKETGKQKSWTNYWIFAELNKQIPKDELPEITSITASVMIAPVSSTGTGTISSDSAIVTGDKTIFTKELKSGYSIVASGQIRIINAINSDISLTIDKAFDPALPAGTNFTYLSTGTGTISSDINEGTKIIGIGTSFTAELKAGDSLTADYQTRIVTAIDDDTQLTIDKAFDTVLAGTTFSYKSPPPVDKAFFNNFPLDLTKDFYPFGERPKFNDTFYIGSKEIFSKEKADIFINIVLSSGLEPDTKVITLNWEFWDGKSWVKLGETTKSGVSSPQGGYLFTDTTNAFTQSGHVTFRCPGIKAREINGEENYWIGVRIISGDYGKESIYETTIADVGNGTGTITSEGKAVTGTGTFFMKELKTSDLITSGNQTRAVTAVASDTLLTIDSSFEGELVGASFTIKKAGWLYKPPSFKPPSIRTFTLAYRFEPPNEKPEINLTYNNFVYQEQNQEQINNLVFKPFQPVTDNSALYLAFDKNIATQSVTIFFPLMEKKAGARVTPISISGTGTISSLDTTVTGDGTAFTTELRKGDTIAASGQTRNVVAIESEKKLFVDSVFSPALTSGTSFSYFAFASLIWEYWNGMSWNRLSNIEDNTLNLTKRDIVQFRAPADITKRICFDLDAEHYWIRIRLEKGKYEDFPRLKAIYTNTVWAHNMVTVEDEILGSSNGKPGQVFKSSRSPVLPGQEVLVMEVSLSEEEREAIIKTEGEDAVQKITDIAGNITGFWVRWVEADHFYFSEPDSRHYILDRNRGGITFGEGERGMIPPAGKDNIKLSYKSGGGVKGNVKAGEITKLRTSFPYIDSVTNHEAADGGGNQEDLDRAREQGPQTLKHLDRAVTSEDFEWLVKEASPKVARVKCYPLTDSSLQFRAGWVTLIIVPESEEPKPLPSRELISEIEEYLFARTSTYLTTYPSQINLIGPGYIKVWVDATVQFTSIAEAKTIEGRIMDKLNNFFHPLHGGPEKKGWNFGRNVYISDVYEAIENTDGVDHVDKLGLHASVQIYELILAGPVIPQEGSSVISADQRIIFSLAGKSTGATDTLIATGFKEGDAIKLSYDDKSAELVVKNVDHDILECEPFWTDTEFSVNSTVETSNKKIKSFILNTVPAQSDISLTPLKIALFRVNDEISLGHIDSTGRVSGVVIKSEVKEITDHIETVFIEHNYLVYSGTHSINKKV